MSAVAAPPLDLVGGATLPPLPASRPYHRVRTLGSEGTGEPFQPTGFYYPWPFPPETDDPEDPTDGIWPGIGCSGNVAILLAAFDCDRAEGAASEAAEREHELADYGTEYDCTCTFATLTVTQTSPCDFQVRCVYVCVCETSAHTTAEGPPIT